MVPLKGEICWVLSVIAFQLARTDWLTALNLLIAYVEIRVRSDRKVLSLRCFLGDYYPRGWFWTFITTIQQICFVKGDNLAIVSCIIWWKSKGSGRLCYDKVWLVLLCANWSILHTWLAICLTTEIGTESGYFSAILNSGC